MAQIIWTEPALNDLNEIAEYIALDKAHAAETLVRSVFRTVQRLKDSKTFQNPGRNQKSFLKLNQGGLLQGLAEFSIEFIKKVSAFYISCAEKKSLGVLSCQTEAMKSVSKAMHSIERLSDYSIVSDTIDLNT